MAASARRPAAVDGARTGRFSAIVAVPAGISSRRSDRNGTAERQPGSSRPRCHIRHICHTGHMRWGRTGPSGAAPLAVVGCAVLVVGMGRAGGASKPTARPSAPVPTLPARCDLRLRPRHRRPRHDRRLRGSQRPPTRHRTRCHARRARRGRLRPRRPRGRPPTVAARSTPRRSTKHRRGTSLHRAPAPRRPAPAHKRAPRPVLPRRGTPSARLQHRVRHPGDHRRRPLDVEHDRHPAGLAQGARRGLAARRRRSHRARRLGRLTRIAERVALGHARSAASR